MTLALKLAFQFEKRLQFKGADLFHARAIRVTEATPTYVTAEIVGGNGSALSLRYQEGRLLTWCDCSEYANFAKCRHLWAAVLEADRRGALSQAVKAEILRLEVDPEEGAGGNGKQERARPSFFQYLQPRVQPPPKKVQLPAWEEQLTAIHRSLEQQPQPEPWPRGFEVLYVMDVSTSKASGAIVLSLYSRSRKKDGQWTQSKELRITAAEVATLPDPIDAESIAAMLGGQEYYSFQYNYGGGQGSTHKALPPILALKLIPILSATGRLLWRSSASAFDLPQLGWDDGEPWRLWLDIRQDDRDQWTIAGSLRRGAERMELAKPDLILESGFLMANGKLARFDPAGGFGWVKPLLEFRRIPFPDRERDAVLAMLLESPVVPPLDIDEPLRFAEQRTSPRVGLRLTQKREWGDEYFQAQILLDYGRGWIEDKQSRTGIWLPEERVYLVRDTAVEETARAALRDLGLRQMNDAPPVWRLAAKSMPRVVRELVQASWHVEAEGKAFRRPGATRVDVNSGIDWFDLNAEVDYGGTSASLPQLLAALRRGETMVRLGDGSFGLLPEEWLKRYAPLAGLGAIEGGNLRFQRNQAGLLDALLAAQPEVRVDEVFAGVRQRIRTFEGVAAVPQPEGFVGQLRDYQREGVGWMEFLREFGFGGCLADDMGVGKTAQMLAVLESRRNAGKGPSLVVAPKSVVFNWRQEAARFTPQLRVLEHTGIARDVALIGQHDLVLTTYGTLLRDVLALSEVQFDYVVLDEAQAIKNSSSASAKAVRILRGHHRMALSGTPIENHLGELWSLFEFLNPGMLGEAKVLQMAGGLGRNPSEESRRLLAHALRPFILRRTKQQVASELPDKTEQTLFCELEGAQKQQYDELRAHYRETLLARIDDQGLNRSKMHVLEALLRLRQAACHPGLLDEKHSGEPSAKLDLLMEHLTEVQEEGHKALVFSQFTSMLAIVRKRLDEQGIRYQYLDGSTTNRQSVVDAFQNDPTYGLFLISLKAGGLGLNLTAAEYVFLLDPWWNPAVEAQAIDRAHRIGQTRPVFAYRLIARDTVEEKVLELQKMKRDLADAILGEDHSVIRDLKREDLELLLS